MINIKHIFYLKIIIYNLIIPMNNNIDGDFSVPLSWNLSKQNLMRKTSIQKPKVTVSTIQDYSSYQSSKNKFEIYDEKKQSKNYTSSHQCEKDTVIKKLSEQLQELRKNILNTQFERKSEIVQIKVVVEQLEKQLYKQKQKIQKLTEEISRLQQQNHKLAKALRRVNLEKLRQTKNFQNVKQMTSEKFLDLKQKTAKQMTNLSKKAKFQESLYTIEKRQKRNQIYKNPIQFFKKQLTISKLDIKQTPREIPNKIPNEVYRLQKKIQSLDKQIKKSRQKLSTQKTERFQTEF